MTLKRASYNARQRAAAELGECAEVPRRFRHENNLGWERVGFYYTHRQYAEQHVLPVNDLRPHLESPSCWCYWSTFTEGGKTVYVHDALDGRDAVERGERLIQ